MNFYEITYFDGFNRVLFPRHCHTRAGAEYWVDYMKTCPDVSDIRIEKIHVCDHIDCCALFAERAS